MGQGVQNPLSLEYPHFVPPNPFTSKFNCCMILIEGDAQKLDRKLLLQVIKVRHLLSSKGHPDLFVFKECEKNLKERLKTFDYTHENKVMVPFSEKRGDRAVNHVYEEMWRRAFELWDSVVSEIFTSESVGGVHVLIKK